MSNLLLLLIVISGTVILYLTMRYTYARFPIAILHPVLTSTAIIISLLLLFNVSYESYMVGGKWIEMFLGPSVVALAYPLYNQRASSDEVPKCDCTWCCFRFTNRDGKHSVIC